MVGSSRRDDRMPSRFRIGIPTWNPCNQCYPWLNSFGCGQDAPGFFWSFAADSSLAAVLPRHQQTRPARARRSRPTNRDTFLKSCSQILTTRHPCARSARFTFLSLARFPFNFLCQKPRLCRGCVPCFGQPCQKHPSTKTATRCLRNAKSGLPNKAILRRHPVT